MVEKFANTFVPRTELFDVLQRDQIEKGFVRPDPSPLFREKKDSGRVSVEDFVKQRLVDDLFILLREPTLTRAS